MKNASITFKSNKLSQLSDKYTVTKLVNTMKFKVGDAVSESDVKKLIGSTLGIKVVIV